MILQNFYQVDICEQQCPEAKVTVRRLKTYTEAKSIGELCTKNTNYFYKISVLEFSNGDDSYCKHLLFDSLVD